MEMYQRITMPKLHGTGPKNLAAAIRLPSAPQRTFTNLKDAMMFMKEQDKKEKKENER